MLPYEKVRKTEPTVIPVTEQKDQLNIPLMYQYTFEQSI